MRRRPRERAQLHGEDIGVRERQAQPAHTQERIGFCGRRQAGDRLVAAGIERATADREQLISRGLERARAFRWDAVGETTVSVYREVA